MDDYQTPPYHLLWVSETRPVPQSMLDTLADTYNRYRVMQGRPDQQIGPQDVRVTWHKARLPGDTYDALEALAVTCGKKVYASEDEADADPEYSGMTDVPDWVSGDMPLALWLSISRGDFALEADVMIPTP